MSKDFFYVMTRNPISLLGATITTISAILIMTLFTIDLVGYHGGGPYLGILAFLILPGIFIMGLLLIPVGIWLQRRRERLAKERGETAPIDAFPVINLNEVRTRRLVFLLAAATALNVVIIATATYKGVEVMESTQFCGTACHSVMAPEFTAYKRSPHSRVGCVDCHIGEGASWFVKSKLSGSWQLVSVALNLYPKPIPVPVHNLRPARETCEQCHWPTKFVGDKMKVLSKFDEDEKNTHKRTVVLLRVGGTQGSASHGIHWHVDPGVKIRYQSDDKRQAIGDIELTMPDGTTKVYKPSTPPANVTAEWRTMDCVDCHNRPTHIYKQPEDEINGALAAGRIDRKLPFIRREGLKVLKATYASHDEARQKIGQAIADFYATNHPEVAKTQAPAIQAASAVLGEIYTTNVWPTMKIEWGTYPSFLGHNEASGCFRCHDEDHKTAEGKVISQDCTTCHKLLAEDDPDPKILRELQQHQ